MVNVKLKRLPSGRNTLDEGAARKDRVISLLYGFYFINTLEEDLSVVKNKRDVSAYFTGSSNRKAGIGNPFVNRRISSGFGRR